ncbi:trihelix transcription factor ASR3-like isoform X2 [Arachis duranensis]|uniref:Trihelix transcription factor ASR3-like isoform X2 n=1 Tax=Arachis duranensis TaxID=130453 RepID=A0A6P4CRV6_ARADU|nr:trihelix transcription factor ASR3-like isoform X2 [Arachis duranensis]
MVCILSQSTKNTRVRVIIINAMESNSEKNINISVGSSGGGSEHVPLVTVAKQPTTATETVAKGETRAKATRHPRWTRQESLVLIESKKLVESGEQINRYQSPPGFVVLQTDPKWDMVSSLCQQRGVKRGAVQCRKRWGNLLTDFRKIKKWETNVKDENESFWMMRNDKRKENKLPGFFDSVVYNVLDGGVCTAAAYPLTLIKGPPKQENISGGGGDRGEGEGVVTASKKDHHRSRNQPHRQNHDEVDEDDEMEDDETIVDSEMGWSTEEENNTNSTTETGKVNNSSLMLLKTPTVAGAKETVMNMMMVMGSTQKIPLPKLPTSEKQPTPTSCKGNYDHPPGFQREGVSQEGHKKRRLSPGNSEHTTNFNNNIVRVLRRNNNMLKAHLGAQNMNYQLAREHQKEQTDSLVAALGKLTDALSKIADKL